MQARRVLYHIIWRETTSAWHTARLWLDESGNCARTAREYKIPCTQVLCVYDGIYVGGHLSELFRVLLRRLLFFSSCFSSFSSSTIRCCCIRAKFAKVSLSVMCARNLLCVRFMMRRAGGVHTLKIRYQCDYRTEIADNTLWFIMCKSL